jgi:CBS domain-containing protein
VSPTTTVKGAAERMAAENVGALVVVEARNPVGIVTDRDLVVRGLAKHCQLSQTTVHQVMTTNPICVTEHAPLAGAIDRMKSHRVRRLIVLSESQEVVGIIALDDILELFAEERQALDAVTSVMRSIRHETL